MSSPSYIYLNNKYDSIWKLLFRNTECLDKWGKSGTKFVILGTDLEGIPEPDGFFVTHERTRVLAIAVISTGTFTKAAWDIFIGSLQVHTFDEENYEVLFEGPNVKLNVYSLFYRTQSRRTILIKDPELLLYNYFKSGTVLTLSTCATTYGGGLRGTADVDNSPGPILEDDNGGYLIKLNHSGQAYQLCITDH